MIKLDKEYEYYAVRLVFGDKSPKIRERYGRYCFEKFRRLPFKFVETGKLNTANHLEITRTIKIDDERFFKSNHTEMSSEINKIVTYIDKTFNIHMSDSTFNEYFNQNWNENVESKIRNLAILLFSIEKRLLSEIPLFLNEFPNIAKILLSYPHFWTVGKEFYAPDKI